MSSRIRSTDIFINCPFDLRYKPIFEAIVFTVYDLGFAARCALENDDSGESRFGKIEKIVEQCRFGIHDLSAVELDAQTGLPRFNMPLELGLFLGCRRFGSSLQRKKVSLILDSDKYRYRKFISDLSGQDIHSHGGEPEQAIREVRDWLAAASTRSVLPGGSEVIGRYRQFRKQLPLLCGVARIGMAEMTFSDLSKMIVAWLRTSR